MPVSGSAAAPAVGSPAERRGRRLGGCPWPAGRGTGSAGGLRRNGDEPAAADWRTAIRGSAGGLRRNGREPAAADRGTAIPLIMLCFLLAGTFVCGSIAASAAFLAQRDLAGICDGAAIAAANAFSRSGTSGSGVSETDGPASLPLDQQAVQRAVAAYRLHELPAETADGANGALSMTAVTDGRVATVSCRRRVRIPFGALLGYRDGLDRTVVARARSPLD
jgi:hypothetical protein